MYKRGVAQSCATECDAGTGIWRNRRDGVISKTVSVEIRNPDGTTTREPAVVKTPVLWEPGSELRILFLDHNDDEQLIRSVIRYAREWERYVNLRLAFVDDEPADIKISFDGDSYYSVLGTESKNSLGRGHSMLLGGLTGDSGEVLTRRVVLHEFGHALGFQHEHLNPVGGIKWKQPDALEYYMEKHRWSRDKVEHNIFQKLDQTVNEFSRFDPDSIMCYPVPGFLTLDGYSVGLNTKLSPVDRRWASFIYPPYFDRTLGVSVWVSPGNDATPGVVVQDTAPGTPVTKLRRNDALASGC